MIRKLLFLTAFITFTSAAFANINHYEKTDVIIKNDTEASVVMTIDYLDGSLEKPTGLKMPLLLTPHQDYQNTVISKEENNDFENFLSIDVVDFENPHNNYLIFSETTDSKNQHVDAHIFDGLGTMFVKSTTNHCTNRTAAGYARCTLTVRD